ncbi:MAG: hypothetical protein HYX48_01580 [Chlamydiales bacterium]|nr:hypothetical protein [Chlamydiales bacterium]
MSALSKVSEASAQSLDNTSQEQPSCCDETITNLFWTTISTLTALLQMATLPLYSLFDDGLGNLLGLEVLRHGTCFSNYVGILTHGGDPSKGGNPSGATVITQKLMPDNEKAKQSQKEILEKTKKYFFVSPDSEIKYFRGYFAVLWIQPAYFAGFSGYASAAGESDSCLVKIYGFANAFFNGLFTPTLRFKFSLEETQKLFVPDKDLGETGCKTAENIPPERLGITGSLQEGLNSDLFNRIARNPAKFLFGLCEVVIAIALSTLQLQGLLIAALGQMAFFFTGVVITVLVGLIPSGRPDWSETPFA